MEEFRYTGAAQFRRYLESLSEEPYRAFQAKLIPGEEKLLGVRVPQLRAIARRIAKQDWRSYLSEASDETCEEAMLQGLVTGYAKMEIEERLERVAAFVPKIRNWEICDVCCSGFTFAAKHREKTYDFLLPYLQTEEEYSVRFAVIMLMDFFINGEYLERLFTLYEEVRHEGYYVKMAVAWALSVCYVKYPEKTETFLDSCKLDDWTFNRTLQKIVESKRVDARTKIKIRAMKRG